MRAFGLQPGKTQEHKTRLDERQMAVRDEDVTSRRSSLMPKVYKHTQLLIDAAPWRVEDKAQGQTWRHARPEETGSTAAWLPAWVKMVPAVSAKFKR